MKELKNQIDKLILVAEEQRAKHMCYGQSGDIREDNGYIDALKLVRLLITTNLKFKTN